jgi:hypothetical protein
LEREIQRKIAVKNRKVRSWIIECNCFQRIWIGIGINNILLDK